MTGAESSLRRLVDRLEPQRLAHDPQLARTGLKDLFPGDPLIVSVLTAAVEHGALAALTERGRTAPLAVLGPRLADDLHRSSGISPARARWAVAAWAIALGAVLRPLPVLPRDGHEPDASGLFDAPADPVTSEATTLRRSDGEPDASEAATRVRSAGAARSSDEEERASTLRAPSRPNRDEDERATDPLTAPMPRPSRRRRRLLVVGAAVVLALAATSTIAALLLRPDAALAASGATGDAVVAAGAAPAALRDGHPLSAGAVVTTKTAFVELRRGDAVVRLGTAGSLRVDDDDSVTLLSGELYVQDAGDPMTVRTGADVATLRNARGIFTCTDAGCTTTSLGERFDLSQAGGATTALTTLTTVSATGKHSFLLRDLMTDDAWFARNDRLDREQHRALHGLPGASILRDWPVSQRRADLPSDLSTDIAVMRSCAKNVCGLSASTRMADAGNTTHHGTVSALDGSGRRFVIDYTPPSTVRCAYLERNGRGNGSDGTERLTDVLTLSGDGSQLRLTGTRSSTFHPSSGPCTGAEYTATKRTALDSRLDFAPLTNDEQQSLLNYARSSGSGCLRVRPATSTLKSDVECGYPSGPVASVEFAVGFKKADVQPAYVEATGRLKPTTSTDCGSGACTGSIGTGRFTLSSDTDGAVLVASYTSSATMVMTLRGTSASELYSWWRGQQRAPTVIQTTPIPRVGI